MAFEFHQKVLFKHCDPAGIVFFPRYFEMMSDCAEAFFETVIGVPFETLHVTHAVPTAAIETQFRAPSRHGDHLTLTLRTIHVGRSSWRYHMQATCAAALRFETKAALVHVDAAGKPTAWPDRLRDKLKQEEAQA